MRLFWLLSVAIIVAAVGASFLWLPALASALLALPFLYIAVVISLAAYRLSPRGGDLQRKIHALVVAAAGSGGRLLDIGCGSGQLLLRLAKAGQGEFVGLDYWGEDWAYSKSQAEQNAKLEGVSNVSFVHGSASSLPFEDGAFTRIVSCMTFHEVQDVADKTASLTEAMRVLAPGGRFAVIDLFDDTEFYPSRDHALTALRRAGAEIASARNIRELLPMGFPMNTRRVLRDAVLVTGTKPPV